MSDYSFISDLNEVTVQSFNLNDSLSSLKRLLEQLFNISLADYSFWLQGNQQLSEDKSLVNHGVEGEGDVQIKLQLKINGSGGKIIDIIDVLQQDNNIQFDDVPIANKRIQWVEAKDFTSKMLQHNIPSDPHNWTVDNVKHWIQWAIETFKLDDIDIDDWSMTGDYICRMPVEEFVSKVPHDPDDSFWTHILVLQKFGQVMVRADQVAKDEASVVTKVTSNKTSSATNVNLWQFLLELLVSKSYKDIIRWVNDDGEFQMVKPDTVARLWGEKKRKSNMTYEKMSRAMRYYYGDMISKVMKKRYVYQFHFDVKEIIGYSPTQLDKLLNEE